jgi:WXG100 family type VII secretion target
MAGQGTEVTTSKLTQVATTLGELIGQYNGEVDRFYTASAEMDSMWEGDANRKYAATLASDRERFDAMAKILQCYVDVLEQDAATYSKAEADTLEVLASNKVR